jgi:predicted nucleotidyltransferase component of viral defense system
LPQFFSPALTTNFMHFSILDPYRRKLITYFKPLKDQFYLAGGTALALQIGHRDSQDFDFFSPQSFDTRVLFEKLRKILPGFNLRKVQDEEDTLSIIVDEKVKLSFFGYNYPVMKEFKIVDDFKLVSLEDIACMKLASITHRSTVKDYIDIYYLLRRFGLNELLILMSYKYNHTLDPALVLKSMVYFDDFTDKHILETMRLCHKQSLSFSQMKEFIQKTVQKYINKRLKF